MACKLIKFDDQSLKSFIVLLMAIAVSFFQQSAAMAETTIPDDEAVAELFGDDIIPTTTFGRSVQPLNRVAENVTVITRADIVRLQARTLDQLLLYYPGVLPYPNQFPGGVSTSMVQGLPGRQCLVTLDGVPLNTISAGFADLSLIPVGNFDSVEIVKGPTSSLWGRSVGASINLVTRDPAKNRIASGYYNGTLGMNNTYSTESVVSGTYEPTDTGYLLAGSGGTTNGFQRGIKGDSSAFYVKLKQQISDKTTLTGVMGKTSKAENFLNNQKANLKANVGADVYYGIAKLIHAISLRSDFEVNAYYFDTKFDAQYFNIEPIPPFIPVSGVNLNNQATSEKSGGVQLSYKYNGPTYWFTAGIDATHAVINNNTYFPATLPPTYLSNGKRPFNAAGYITGGIDFTDRITITSSFRYDWYSDLKNTYAPSAGIIFKVDDKTLLRATYGWGYSMPVLTGPTKDFETLWRVQGGLETSTIPGLWLKTNIFYDRTRNVHQNLFYFDQNPELNKNLVRQGFEIEAKTAPILNTSFGIGYTYTDIFNSDTGAQIYGLPRHQLIGSANWKYSNTDIGVYSRYVNYNDTPNSNDSVLWDIMVNQRIISWDTGTISLRLAAQNIFSGRQSPSPLTYGYIPLLVTGGVRVEF